MLNFTLWRCIALTKVVCPAAWRTFWWNCCTEKLFCCNIVSLYQFIPRYLIKNEQKNSGEFRKEDSSLDQRCSLTIYYFTYSINSTKSEKQTSVNLQRLQMQLKILALKVKSFSQISTVWTLVVVFRQKNVLITTTFLLKPTLISCHCSGITPHSNTHSQL